MIAEGTTPTPDTTTSELPELPQRYFDGLAYDNPILKNPMVTLGARFFSGGDPEPTPGQLRAYGRLMMVGDDPADAWARCENADNRAEWYRMFNAALEQGVDTIADAPPELHALLGQVREEPIWLERRLLEHGTTVTRRVGNMGSVVMGHLALQGGYGSSAIVKPLVFTGALESGTSRRLSETANFAIDVTRPGGLRIGGRGWKSAIRVRMMHGIIRKRILQTPGWRSDLWGVPINQADMIATNIAFSYVFITGHRVLGYRFSRDDVRAYLHLWRYVGYLMGIDDAQLPSTEEEAMRMMILTTRMQAPPDDDSRALAAAFREAHDEELPDELFDKLTAWFDAKLGTGYARFMLGRAAAKELKIPTTPWIVWPMLFAPGNFALETVRQSVPGANKLAVAFGDYVQRRKLAVMLDGEEASYVPGVELTARAGGGCPAGY